MAKETAQRPADAQALLTVLDRLSSDADYVLEADKPTTSPFGVQAEQGLLCVIMAAPVTPLAEEVTLEPVESAQRQALFEALRSALAVYGAHVEPLADGSVVATLFQERSSATDQATQGARCAVAIKERWPEAIIVLTTGRGVLNERLPVGEALDRAGTLLRAGPPETSRPEYDRILIDEVTAGLVATRFPVSREKMGRFLLHGEELSADASRPLLGKPTPCVGRELEVSMLEATLRSCVEDSTPRALLMLGPPGMGKSRLLHEFLRRLETRRQDVLILLGRGDPMSAGSSCGLLGQAIRRLCEAGGSEPLAVRQARLAQRIPIRLPAASAQRVTEFMGELCNIPFSDDRSAKLRAARQDARIMADQLSLALTDFLRAESQEQPVLLILEDLHWGDALTMKLIDTALRELSEQPFMVLGLGRPEVGELFPNLWTGRAQPLLLRGLGRKAQERLVRQILSTTVSDQTVERMIEQAAGNALLLEELIRAYADGKGDELPATVMAMLQARIGNLDATARRVLRAASVFGTTFWKGGISPMVHDERLPIDVARQLETLVDKEILEHRRDSRFPNDPEYRFRHSLLSEAAYSLLTQDDRARCHRLAGAYLEQLGETDAVVLAEHAHRGGELPRAIPYFIRAAEQALDGNDLGAALHRTQQGVACGAKSEQLGSLLTIQAAAHLWRSELEAAYDVSTTALSLLPEGSIRWCRAMLTLFFVTTYLGKREHFADLIDRFGAVEPSADAGCAYTEAASWLVMMSSFIGKRQLGLLFLSRMYKISAGVADADPSIRGWVKLAHSILCHWVENDLWLKQQLSREAMEAAEQAGNRRMLGFATVALGLAELYLGDFARGFVTMQSVVQSVKQLPDETILAGTAMGFYALGMTEDGTPHPEAEQLALACIARVPGTAPSAAVARISLARVLSQQGDYAQAEGHARQALSILLVEPVPCLLAYSALVRILLLRGKVTEARTVADKGMALLESLDGTMSTEIELRLVAAEARQACGDTVAAHSALAEALHKLQLSADKIPDLTARARFLSALPVHVRVQQLAMQWLGETAA